MLESLLVFLPELLVGGGFFTLFEGTFKFLKNKKFQKYSMVASKALGLVDRVLEDNPDYDDSRLDEAIDLAVSVSADGKLNGKDFLRVKEYVVSLYDPREAKKSKKLSAENERLKAVIEKQIRDKK